MRKYIDHAIFWDFIFIIIIGTSLSFSNTILIIFLKLPTIENVHSFGISLITVSATLIGFLLTIITVIVTFKKGFEENKSVESDNSPSTQIPDKTIFEKSISKESKFYGSQIHKKVVDVFVNAAYEIGIVLFILLIIQFNIISISINCISIVSFCAFIALLLSITRSLFIFRLFLKVHLHEKS